MPETIKPLNVYATITSPSSKQVAARMRLCKITRTCYAWFEGADQATDEHETTAAAIQAGKEWWESKWDVRIFEP